ncbi:MAG: DUF3047 domain-containing protein [Hydrogenophaga sp.]|uniref:DUF3047 domain-containing protein n=1 Tax=Hydrogenophaga sp. TaxID=1904254 RepID=UPI001DE20BB6|nr:DUF3047 domain-containing protein [Hydrogenophaga sp.]MBX3609234.1 DUF3047 domain-containing protein [Hydrogenophaga sp.]
MNNGLFTHAGDERQTRVTPSGHHVRMLNAEAPLPTPWSRRRWLLSAGATALAGCASPPGPQPQDDALARSAWARATDLDGMHAAGEWTHYRYGNRRPTDYSPTQREGRPAVHAVSHAGNSTLRLPLQPKPLQPGTRLRFSWWVPALLPEANLRDKTTDDAVVRIILSFDGDHSGWTQRDHMLSNLVQLVTGEPLPDSSLMYVWDNREPVGAVIDNPHTRRIRKLVVQQGPGRLHQWVEHERDVWRDFQQAFGTPPGPLTGLGIMTDSNNTGADAQAWFGPLSLRTGASFAG